ncbi:hypothetical protein ACO2RV_22125 [Ancylobacter sp. VNQ12]|uniref:hypothetical protein n=1 Tax=Ancylobacter sp. VNQ12 TaxID=3400920 RepID=UPI003BFD533C
MSKHPSLVVHRPGRVIFSMRFPGLLEFFQVVAAAGRERSAPRFSKPSDWRRLVALGAMVITLAGLGLAHLLFYNWIPDYIPGIAAIFGGALLSIGIIRIARPAFYLDWIAVGLIYTGLGAILSGQPALVPTDSFVLFCLVFLGSAVLRLWIGATCSNQNGRAWLTAGAGAGVFCVVWLVATRVAAMRIVPDIVLCVDLSIYGLSIARFGYSLRKPVE